MSRYGSPTQGAVTEELVMTGMHFECAASAVQHSREAANPALTSAQQRSFKRRADAVIRRCRGGECRLK